MCFMLEYYFINKENYPTSQIRKEIKTAAHNRNRATALLKEWLL